MRSPGRTARRWGNRRWGKRSRRWGTGRRPAGRRLRPGRRPAAQPSIRPRSTRTGSWGGTARRAAVAPPARGTDRPAGGRPNRPVSTASRCSRSGRPRRPSRTRRRAAGSCRCLPGPDGRTATAVPSPSGSRRSPRVRRRTGRPAGPASRTPGRCRDRCRTAAPRRTSRSRRLRRTRCRRWWRSPRLPGPRTAGWRRGRGAGTDRSPRNRTGPRCRSRSRRPIRCPAAARPTIARRAEPARTAAPWCLRWASRCGPRPRPRRSRASRWADPPRNRPPRPPGWSGSARSRWCRRTGTGAASPGCRAAWPAGRRRTGRAARC